MHSMLNNHEVIHSCVVSLVCLFASYDLPKNEELLMNKKKRYRTKEPLRFFCKFLFIILLSLLVQFLLLLYSLFHHHHHHYR
jgi:hypothetical protein